MLALSFVQDVLSCSVNFRCLGGTIPSVLSYLCTHGAAEESCVTYRAGDSWDHGHQTDACRQTCEMVYFVALAILFLVCLCLCSSASLMRTGRLAKWCVERCVARLWLLVSLWVYCPCVPASLCFAAHAGCVVCVRVRVLVWV